MRKKSSIISHLVDHEKIELDKHIEEIVLQNQSSSGGGGGGGGIETDPIWTSEKTGYLKLDQTTPQTIIGSNHIPVSASAPENPINGSIYINSGDNKLYIYYSSAWQELHELTAATPVTGNPTGLLLVLTYNLE